MKLKPPAELMNGTMDELKIEADSEFNLILDGIIR